VSGVERTLSYARGDAAPNPVATPYLVVALECERPTALPVRLCLADVDHLRVGRGSRRGVHRTAARGVTLEIADGWMSTQHARLARTAAGAWEVVDEGSKNGTFVGGARVDRRLLDDGDLVEAGSTMLLFRDRVRRDPGQPADLEIARCDVLATLSPVLAARLAPVDRLARSDVPIVITGETGTGKELLARRVHADSGRRGPFTAVNCAALPESLAEAELFGHRRGAFSGATEDRVGWLRAADRGTLFLDEIADLPLASQGKLLRVLQEREVTPLGDTRAVPIDLRLVAATHRDLGACVDAGRFRADLLARLAGHVIELPAVRDRREDVGLLCASLIRRLAADRAESVRFDRDAGRAVMAHDWPLNVREIEQALRAALAVADDLRITLGRLPSALSAEPSADRALRERLTRLFEKHGGNVSSVARELGKARNQIRRWCKRLHIDIAAYR
jgi:transcriptional regulator with PAS, ATPase and Fis domain